MDEKTVKAAVPDLLKTCQFGADDGMDGDLLTMVAEHLLSLAEKLSETEAGPPYYCRMLKTWADKLLTKQELQAAAIVKAKESKEASYDI